MASVIRWQKEAFWEGGGAEKYPRLVFLVDEGYTYANIYKHKISHDIKHYSHVITWSYKIRKLMRNTNELKE